MIEIDENARRAIANARALLDALQTGGWKQVCVTGDEGDYFIARDIGTVNPLLTAVETSPAPASGYASFAVNAPHVGTITWLAAVKQTIAKGDVIARLAVLDQEIEVLAAEAGVVSEHAARKGDLVEFNFPLLVLAI